MRTGRVWLSLAWFCAFALTAAPVVAQSDFAEIGRYRTQDGKAVIDVQPCGTGLCGRLVGMSLAHPTDTPPLDVWGRSQCGEAIVRLDRQNPQGRWLGTVLDPRSGAMWSAEVWRESDGLHLRGYIGLPVFGATQVWPVYTGATRENCDFDH